MPRKSAASLSVIPLAPKPFPEPPCELTKRQAAIWREIVSCRPPEYFDRACWALLVAYCRHADMAEVIAGLIRNCDPDDLYRYGRFLDLAARESKMMMMLSAKLRLAPAHVRRVEHVVKTPSKPPPWQTVK
jgi:hypothetical protein